MYKKVYSNNGITISARNWSKEEKQHLTASIEIDIEGVGCEAVRMAEKDVILTPYSLSEKLARQATDQYIYGGTQKRMLEIMKVSKALINRHISTNELENLSVFSLYNHNTFI